MAARRDRGSVSAELAMALPAVVLVLGLVLAAVGWARAAVTATDAAALGARVAAVEGQQAARDQIAAALPGAVVAVEPAGEVVTVTVQVAPVAWLPGATARSSALVQP